MRSFTQLSVQRTFEGYPSPIRDQLMKIRELIFETADATPRVGQIEETLKWREPAYVTPQSKSGTTLRLAWKQVAPSRYGLYFHCQTNLAQTFRELFPETFQFESDRGIIFEVDAPIPEGALRTCIKVALTYHLSKKKKKPKDVTSVARNAT